MMSYNRQKVVSWGGTWHRPVLSIKKNVLVLLCKCCGFKIRVWMGIVMRARSNSAKRDWRSVELCIYKPYLLHCTVWSNHGAVPWHMAHYNILRVWKTMTKTQGILLTTAGAIKKWLLFLILVFQECIIWNLATSSIANYIPVGQSLYTQFTRPFLFVEVAESGLWHYRHYKQGPWDCSLGWTQLSMCHHSLLHDITTLNELSHACNTPCHCICILLSNQILETKKVGIRRLHSGAWIINKLILYE